MTIHRLFPTFVYSSTLQQRGANEFNRRLLKECRQLRHDDAAGRRWSAKNYPGGYTSYGSVHWLQRISPTFKALPALGSSLSPIPMYKAPESTTTCSSVGCQCAGIL